MLTHNLPASYLNTPRFFSVFRLCWLCPLSCYNSNYSRKFEYVHTFVRTVYTGRVGPVAGLFPRWAVQYRKKRRFLSREGFELSVLRVKTHALDHVPTVTGVHQDYKTKSIISSVLVCMWDLVLSPWENNTNRSYLMINGWVGYSHIR
jgi:hypothetical protein